MMSSPGNIPADGTPTTTTVTDTSGVPRTVKCGVYYVPTYLGTPLAMNAADNEDTYGVVVGRGTASVTPTDYVLSSKIPHGSGSGQLDYGTHTVTSSYTSSSSYCEISRVFVNVSGSDVVVRETGIIARNNWSKDTADVKFLIARDVLPSPVTVKNLGSLTVRYRISLTL
jgi:hypothetical protein